MPTTLRWIASNSASALHAAEAIARGLPLADASLAAAIQSPATQLAEVISAGGLPSEAFWSHAAALSAGIHNNRELAAVVLTKVIGRGAKHAELTDVLAAAFTALEQAYDTSIPDSIKQLELRSGPLREQWEARGPGMLAQAGRLTHDELLVSQADVLVVHPALGGSGRAHLAYNSVRIEAVLANPLAALPEVVRLAWLIAQLNNDLPLHQGNLTRDRVTEVGGLALIPPILSAAENVELARSDLATVTLALEAWTSKPDASSAAEVLDQWWQVYVESRPAWSIALAALDKMLAAIH